MYMLLDKYLWWEDEDVYQVHGAHMMMVIPFVKLAYILFLRSILLNIKCSMHASVWSYIVYQCLRLQDDAEFDTCKLMYLRFPNIKVLQQQINGPNHSESSKLPVANSFSFLEILCNPNFLS